MGSNKDKSKNSNSSPPPPPPPPSDHPYFTASNKSHNHHHQDHDDDQNQNQQLQLSHPNQPAPPAYHPTDPNPTQTSSITFPAIPATLGPNETHHFTLHGTIGRTTLPSPGLTPLDVLARLETHKVILNGRHEFHPDVKGRIELERADAKHVSSASARKATGSMDADSSLPSSRKVVPHALRGLAAAPRLALLPPPVSQVGRMQSVGSMALDIRELDDDDNGSRRASGRGTKGRKSSGGSVPAVPVAVPAAAAVAVPVPAGVARLKAGLAGSGSGSRSGSMSTAPGTGRNSMASQKGEKADGKRSGSRFSGGDGGGSGGSGSKKSDRKEKVLVCTFCKVVDKSGRGEKVRAITECGGSALCEGCIGQMFKEGGGLVWRANGPGK